MIILHQTVALPALFVAFTADYVFQERFFRMPRWVGALSGAGLYAIAAVMIKFGSSDLVVPLALFAAISFISLVSNISKMRKSHG